MPRRRRVSSAFSTRGLSQQRRADVAELKSRTSRRRRTFKDSRRGTRRGMGSPEETLPTGKGLSSTSAQSGVSRRPPVFRSGEADRLSTGRRRTLSRLSAHATTRRGKRLKGPSRERRLGGVREGASSSLTRRRERVCECSAQRKPELLPKRSEDRQHPQRLLEDDGRWNFEEEALNPPSRQGASSAPLRRCRLRRCGKDGLRLHRGES